MMPGGSKDTVKRKKVISGAEAKGILRWHACSAVQREKDQKLDELNHVRSHDMACRKLKHRLDLDLKRDKARPPLFNSHSGCLSNVKIASK